MQRVEQKVTGFEGLKSYRDVRNVPLSALRDVKCLEVDKGTLRAVRGIQEVNSNDLGEDVVMVHRTSRLDGTKELLCLAGNDLYKLSGGTFSSIKSGLTASERGVGVRFKNKDFITNGKDPLLVYDEDVKNVGIDSPTAIKVIGDFEESETWTGLLTTKNAVHVVHGAQAGYLTSDGSSGWVKAYRSVSLDLTEFESGHTSALQDFIRLYLSVDTVANVNSDSSGGICIKLGTDTSNCYYTLLNKTDEWMNNAEDHVLLTIDVRKESFRELGTPPAWSNITYVEIAVRDNGNVFTMWFDYLTLVKTAPLVYSYRKQLARMEAAEAWSNGTPDYEHYKQGASGWKLSLSSECKLSISSTDLSKWWDGSSTSDRDEVCVWVYRHSTTFSDTDTITLKLYDGADYFHTSFTGSDLSSPSGWTLIKKKKSEFSSSGTPSWASIDSVSFTASAHGTSVTVDDLALRKYVNSKMLMHFESSQQDDITLSPTSGSSYAEYVTFGGSTVVRCFSVAQTPVGATLAQDLDLTQYDDGTPVTDADKFTFKACFEETTKYLKDIKLLIDVDDGSFTTNYYEATWSLADITETKSKRWMNLSVKRGEMLRHGSSGSWSTVKAIRLQVTTSYETKGRGVTYYLDNLELVAAGALNGEYVYKVQFETAETRSELSEMSKPVKIEDSDAFLTNIPTSPDSRVLRRLVFRATTDTLVFRLAFYINDNTTTKWVDDTPDVSLGDLADETYGKPPIGKYLIEYDNQLFLGNCINPDDSALVMRSRVYKCEQNKPYQWPNSNYYLLSTDDGSEVRGFAKLRGRLYCMKDFTTWTWEGSRFIPVSNHGATAPDSIASNDVYVFHLENDRVYVFDGFTHTYVSRDIEPVLEGFTDDELGSAKGECYKDYYLLAVKDKVFAFHIPSRQWTVLYELSLTTLYYDRVMDRLYGGVTGYVRQLLEGVSILGSPISFEALLGYSDLGTPNYYKTEHFLFLTTNNESSEDVTLTLVPYYDVVESTSVSVVVEPGLRTRIVRLPTGTGYMFSLKIVGSVSDEFSISGIVLTAMVSEVEI